jgi:hypothetical protein
VFYLWDLVAGRQRHEAPGDEAVGVHGADGGAQEGHPVEVDVALEGGGGRAVAREGDAVRQADAVDDGEGLLDDGLGADELQQQVVGFAEVQGALPIHGVPTLSLI